MKHYSFMKKIVALMLVLSVIGAVGVLTAYAEPEDTAEQQEVVAEETPQEEPQEQVQEEPQEQVQEEPQEQVQEEPQEQEQEQVQEQEQEQEQEQAQEQAQEQVQEQAQEQEQEQEDYQQQETPQNNAQETPQENEQEQAQDNSQDDAQEDSDTDQESGQQNEWYDYIYSYDDAVSSYLEPENLGDLPKIISGQVPEATAVPMPTVSVSDASTFSGIVMWLCVALGIAVIVGVLVSKRTRRRGA